MRLLKIFRRKRRVWYWFGCGPFEGRATGPYQTKLDAVLTGPKPLPQGWAYLSKEKV